MTRLSRPSRVPFSFLCLAAALSLPATAGCELDAADAHLGQAESALTAPNLLANASFDTVGPSGSPVSVTTAVPGGAGNSAAASWTMFTNTAGLIMSQLLPDSRPGGSGNMIHVRTRGAGNGLVQVFDLFNRGPSRTFAYAWIYVIRGKVGIGTGNGGNTGIDAATTVVGQWQRVDAYNGVNPANEFIIYATVPDTEFYVSEAGVYSQNLLANPGFEVVGPSGSPTTVTTVVPGGAGNSAAAAWTLFTNNPGTIWTELATHLVSPSGSNRTLHVITDAANNGVVQVFAPFGSGPTNSMSAVWVYVRRGTVFLGTGNGGNTGEDVASTTNNQWELLQAPNGVQPANELIVYSKGGGADFYLDNAEVYATP
jgi:hypothetical protein